MTAPRPFTKKIRAIKPVHGGPLWEERQQGKPVTPSNVWEDVKESAYDLRDEPEEFGNRVQQRVNDYQDKGGPDINKPVPLTDQPYRRRRK